MFSRAHCHLTVRTILVMIDVATKVIVQKEYQIKVPVRARWFQLQPAVV